METKFRNRVEIISLITFNFINGKYTQGGPNKRESIQGELRKNYIQGNANRLQLFCSQML